MTEQVDARPSAIAGSWYPANRLELSRSVDSFMHLAEPPSVEPSRIKGVIVPHAGHIYSGRVAGKAYGLLKGCQPEIVVVLSPHHGYSPYPFISSGHTHYETPLGQVQIEHEALGKTSEMLEKETLSTVRLVRQDTEHSLEIQLPFLQRALNCPFRVLPIMLRSHNLAHLNVLGEAIAKTLADRSWLLVVSTDLSHFHPLVVANKLDRAMLAAWEKFDEDMIMRSVQAEKTEACGLNAVLAGVRACKLAGATTLSVLAYDTSASTTSDETSVVGYGSAVIFAKN